MQLRPTVRADLDSINEIDATIDSTEYLHVDRSGTGFDSTFRLEMRPLRERLIGANRLSDELIFLYRQIIEGHDEGLSLVAEHDELIVAAMVAVTRADRGTLEIVDLRVDFDQRREGLATAMIFQATHAAREDECRALAARVVANNAPGNRMLLKCGFELNGLDTRFNSNHDLAKEVSTLFWYAPLD